MLGREEIALLIPQHGAMVLLDRIVAWDAAGIVCTAASHRRPDNPLRRGGLLPAIAGIEYGGQAMAAHGGLLEGGARRPGYIASLRRVALRAERLDDVGPDLRVEATVVHRDLGGFVYAFAVYGEGAAALVSGRIGVLLRRGA